MPASPAPTGTDPPYDALLLVAYGGPNGPDDVMPFLENALRGKRIPRERMLEVAHHYDLFGGVSPINEHCRNLLAAITAYLKEAGPALPVYWGNRNWHPYLKDTLEQMKRDGVKRALAFFTSPYSSYSSCRQYRENVEAAREAIGEGAPVIDKLRAYYNHPGFIHAMIDRVHDALEQFDENERSRIPLVFTAHSIPTVMAEGCEYVAQLKEACRLVTSAFEGHPWQLVYQSRSGPPHQPWLEPDICDHLRETRPPRVILVPIGFINDHMEVVYDLDTEAKHLSDELRIKMVRAKTVGTHPKFISMIGELVRERCEPDLPRQAMGDCGVSHDLCPSDCCPSGRPAQGARPKA